MIVFPLHIYYAYTFITSLHLHIDIYIHIYIYIHLHAFIHTYIYIYTFINIYIYNLKSILRVHIFKTLGEEIIHSTSTHNCLNIFIQYPVIKLRSQFHITPYVLGGDIQQVHIE